MIRKLRACSLAALIAGLWASAHPAEAAGYAGAMIWKALLLDEGAGVEQDLPRAAELFHRAAVSGDTSYGPIGKMHYATVLYLGRGVEKDQAEAMKWFQAAADEGSEEAREFLNTGYHTGYRDQNGLGAGTPTAAARAPLLTPAPGGTAMASADAIKSEPQADALPVRPAKVVTNVARKLINASRPEQVLPAPASAPVPASPDVEVRGQQLQEQHALAAQSGGPKMPLIMGLLLAACFAFGIFRQQQGARSVAGRPAGN